MPLTANTIKAAKPADKNRRLYDAKGLYLEVTTKGGKYWRFKYRFKGKEKRLSLGVYPEISLKGARLRRKAMRALLDTGMDPSIERKVSKQVGHETADDTFEFVAREWHEKYKHTWTAEHAGRILRRLEADIFPWVGSITMDEVTPPVLLKCLRRIEARGALDTAHRALNNCGKVFKYGIATGKAQRDSAADLKGALPPVVLKHHASITSPNEIGDLLRDIDGYTGYFVTRCAMQLAPLLFVRPGELRHAEWSEFDLENATWRIPAEKMKMADPHIVPLSTQAVEILLELYPLTGSDGYVFPGVRSRARPMSENTVNAGLRRLGYEKSVMTGHGFRSMASTLLNEQGWQRDAIERQLAHQERNKSRASYNYAQYMPERIKMMQAWSDYLTGLKKGADVVAIKKVRKKT
ncbi:MAG: tyrosine-type recombinase/integrase [Gammaproteobacteria bacterium]|nr:tyrosine-type recombinase/integrase [Gammaproteobacteria bacterium]MDX2486192.1 tyrosine-type recombinase/integrase [Gammaproteobacteria bacterium]